MRAVRLLSPFVATALILWLSFLAVVDGLGRDFLATDMAAAGCIGVAVVGLVLLVGAAQQFNLGQGAFFGLGAYVAAVSVNELDVSPLIAVALSVLVASMLAWPIGRVLNRLSDLYFAVATLALTIIATSVIHQLSDYTGGEDGMSAPFFQVGEVVLSEPRERFWLTWGVALVSALLVTSYLRSRRGRALRAVGGDEHAARALGINPVALKTQAFVMSSALAGLGGALLAFTTGFIHPGAFGVGASIQLVVVVVLGAALVVRSLLMAFLIALLPVLFESLQQHLELIYGGVLVLVLINLTRAAVPGESTVRERVAGWATAGTRPARRRVQT
jgi:branched-chain amino acid transport system permease protein